MKDNPIIEYIFTSEEPFYCDCCGNCFPEGFKVLFNGDLVHQYCSDGHLSSEETEGFLIDNLSQSIQNYYIEEINKEHTEEKRIIWNIDHPGNGIARTPESWLEYKNSLIEHIHRSFIRINKKMEYQPTDNILKIQLFLIWFEDTMCEKIDFNIIE